MPECARVVTDKERGLITPPCHRWRFGQGVQVPELKMNKTRWVDLGHSPLHQPWHLNLGLMRERTGCYIVPSSPGNGTPGYTSKRGTHGRAADISGAQVKNAAGVSPR